MLTAHDRFVIYFAVINELPFMQLFAGILRFTSFNHYALALTRAKIFIQA